MSIEAPVGSFAMTVGKIAIQGVESVVPSLGVIQKVPGVSVVPSVFTEAFTSKSQDLIVASPIINHSDAEIKQIWDEIRSEPSLNFIQLERAFAASDAIRRIKIQPQVKIEVKPYVEPVAKPIYGIASQPKTETRGAIEWVIGQQEKKEKKIEVPKAHGSSNKKPIIGTIIFKKDNPVSAYRLARAREKFKILNQEKNNGVVNGEELNAKLGSEILAEKSTLLPQLGLQKLEDGSNMNGFRKILGTLKFNNLEDGLRKIHEANEKHIPVKIGGDGMVVTEKEVEEVLQGGNDLILKAKEKFDFAGVQ